jgi:hypothetical protein
MEAAQTSTMSFQPNLAPSVAAAFQNDTFEGLPVAQAFGPTKIIVRNIPFEATEGGEGGRRGWKKRGERKWREKVERRGIT